MYNMAENGFPRPRKRWHSRPSSTTDNDDIHYQITAIEGLTDTSKITHGRRHELSSHGVVEMPQHDASMPAALRKKAVLTKISDRDIDLTPALEGQPPQSLLPTCLHEMDFWDDSKPDNELPFPKCRLHNNSSTSSLTTMSQLAWMKPIPPADSILDRESPYHPSRSTISISALRFDFQGALIPPRVARMIPSSRGLHHHAEAPEAAGYTIRELAFLCRSAVPAQRCIAYRTLGRLLYRLGSGEWGDHDDTLATGIWDEIKCGRVLDSLHEASSKEFAHSGCHAFATEALTLYHKGGWSPTPYNR